MVSVVPVATYRWRHLSVYDVEPPIKDPPRKGQPPYKGHSSRSLYHGIALIMFLTSKKRTTSKIRAEAVSPKCPLFGGSTVIMCYYFA